MTTDELLPIGSVICAGKKEIPLVISGYVAQSPENEIFDYVCFLYPRGIDKSMKAIFIDNKNIVKILHHGYKYDKFDNFAKKIIKLNQEVRNKEQ